MLDYSFDGSFKDDNIKIICGTDEAGRGPLAGPVVAAACIIKDGYVIEGLDDSKKLTEKKREKLYEIITNEASLSWGVASASPEEIDKYNILEASLLAMRRAISQLSPVPDLILVDGNVNRGFPYPAKAIVGGDALSQSIAAASVIAKVTRDRMCASYDEMYPGYGFAKHKGYPTKEHKLAVYKYGPTEIHRKSFLSFLERDRDKLAAQLEKESAK